MPNTAIIFDLDDTLIRSASLWKAAESSLLEWMGSSWSAELAAKYKGMNALDVARVIHEQLHSPLALPECQQRLRDALIAGFAAPLEAMPGAVALVRRLREIFPLAVASGSPLAAIRAALTQLEILDGFEQIVSSESVPRGKPHPDVFLRTAELMRTPPSACLVFEDSLIGCQAARAAGMPCFFVPSGPIDPFGPIATQIFASLAQVTIDHVRAVLKAHHQ